MKKARSVRVLVAAASIAVGSFAFAQSSSQHGGAGHSGQAQASKSQGAKVDMHASMMAGMQKMQEMKPTGDTDKDFAMMMRMHHQQAVDMAKAEVQGGKSSELKAMAQKIIRDQQKEIAQLDKWLAKNK
jgi:uncharacterized protein (DUF305 family)